MSTTHTPEPWYVETEHPANKLCPHHSHSDLVVVTPCGRITQTGDTIARRHANAKLIAAAPELRAALIDCEAFLDSINRHTGGKSVAVRDVLERIVRPALAKAQPPTKE